MNKINLENFPFKEEWIDRAGTHSESKIPEEPKIRLYFSLLEALDWNCFYHKDCPSEPSRDDVINFLKENREEILNAQFEPPSYIGIMSGVYNFLKDPEQNPPDISLESLEKLLGTEKDDMKLGDISYYRDIPIKLSEEYKLNFSGDYIYHTYDVNINNVDIHFTIVKYAKETIDEYFYNKEFVGKTISYVSVKDGQKYKATISKIAVDNPNSLHSGRANISIFDKYNNYIIGTDFVELPDITANITA